MPGRGVEGEPTPAGGRKVALVAFGCYPGWGSEQGVGWAWAWAAAERNEVWLVTDAASRAVIEDELARRPGTALHPVYVAQTRLVRADPLSGRAIRVRYALWLVAAHRAIRRLQRSGVRFDVGHHLTFSNDWMPPAFWSRADPPFVWGPIGGAPPLSLRALRWMGWRGGLAEVVRGGLPSLSRATVGRLFARRAALVLAQNDTVARRTPGRVRAESNTAIDPREIAVVAGAPAAEAGGQQRGRRRKAVFAGRILAWKGGALAIAALAHPAAADWELDVYGEGSDLARMQRLARRHKVGDRVHFLGRRPRSELFGAMASADALLLPSLADAAPWIVGEAMALGCPVVCVARGGPPWLLRQGGGGVAVPFDRNVVGGLAKALAGLDGGRARSQRWSVSRLPDLLDEVYGEACASREPALLPSRA